MDACESAKHDTIDQFILNYMLAIRQDERYKHATMFVYIESNMSFIIASRVANLCTQDAFHPVIIDYQDQSPARRPGIWTGKVEKERYVQEVQRSLMDCRLVYAKDMLCPYIKSAEKAQGQLNHQLSLFHREVKEPKDTAFGRPRITYTGKAPGCKDDLALVLQMALYWSRNKRGSQQYIDMAQSHGWDMN